MSEAGATAGAGFEGTEAVTADAELGVLLLKDADKIGGVVGLAETDVDVAGVGTPASGSMFGFVCNEGVASGEACEIAGVRAIGLFVDG